MDLHQHFGLSRPPFDMVGQPTSLYMSKAHREGLAALEWGLLHEPGSFTLLVGEVGTGKTTLIAVVLGRHYDLARIAYVINPRLGFEEMLRVILEQLGYLTNATTKLELLRKFEWVLTQLRVGERIAVIVDEAQVLSDETLEELRLFSNYGRDSRGHLEILLVGQPELLTRLMAPSLRQFHQRIGARAVLNPLRREEAFEYIDHKLRDAGGSARAIFAEGALNEIVGHSQGIPRQLNLLCNNALIRAYAIGLRCVSAKIARAAIDEYENLGRAVETFPKPLVRPVLRSITARPAIAVIGLGLVALAGLYFLGVGEGPRAELVLRGETTPIVSTNVAQKRDTAISTVLSRPTGSNTAALQKGIAALIPSSSPPNGGEVSRRVVANASSASRTVASARLTNPTHDNHSKARETFAYSVRSGDTIEKIALRQLGSRVKVESVVEANPQLRDVNRIYPGDTVFLPTEPTRRHGNEPR
jgi:general secretion pathway protein A